MAGLVYSVCMNYSNRVKGNRPVGEKVFMQGGVCYNRAVPLAMAGLVGPIGTVARAQDAGEEDIERWWGVVGAAIYLEEYARDNWLNRLIQTNINNLAGVPSIIYGMLGLAVFVRTLVQLTSGALFGAVDPSASASKISIRAWIRATSGSSSGAELVAERTRSPKS